MDDSDEFEANKRRLAAEMAADPKLAKAALETLILADSYDFTYQWHWGGLPIIQSPIDILVTQEIVWAAKPTVIIEAGVARGGSVVFLASLLSMLGEGGRVIGVDIDIRAHNRARIEAHKFAPAITLIQGSSIDEGTVAEVRSHIRPDDRVMVVLDSNHTHDHVLAELELYAPLVTQGQYMIVADTLVELIPAQAHRPRPWGIGDNPMTAMDAYLASHPEFEIDQEIENKLLLSCNPRGYLKRR